MAKYIPHGSTFSIGGDFVGGLTGITIPDRKRGEAETTDTDSGGNREYLPGLREHGTVQLTFRHDPDDVGQLALEANYDAAASAAVETCIITLPDASHSGTGGRTYTFQGFVTEPPSGDLKLADDDVAEQTCTIKVGGLVTIGTSTS